MDAQAPIAWATSDHASHRGIDRPNGGNVDRHPLAIRSPTGRPLAASKLAQMAAFSSQVFLIEVFLEASLARISHQTPSRGAEVVAWQGRDGDPTSAAKRWVLLHIEDRIVGSDAVQGATYGAAAGGW